METVTPVDRLSVSMRERLRTCATPTFSDCTTVYTIFACANSVCVCVCVGTGEGEDYIGIENKLMRFTPDTRTICCNVTIMNDGDCEDLEYFSVSLSSSVQRVLVTPSTGYIIISDPPLCSQYNVLWYTPWDVGQRPLWYLPLNNAHLIHDCSIFPMWSHCGVYISK